MIVNQQEDSPFFLAPLTSLGRARNKKSKSSTKSDYEALGHTTTEIIWLWWLLRDLGIPISGPTLLYTDSDSAKRLAFNNVFHERTKHVENCHIIQQHISRSQVSPTYWPDTIKWVQ